MATRALIGTIETDAAGNQILTATYNHYDGYPENLGVALNTHYGTPSEARKVSNMGYISYIQPETGEIEAKNQQSPDKIKLSDDFKRAMQEVYDLANDYSANYAYLYDFENEEWLMVKQSICQFCRWCRLNGISI